MIQDLYEEDTGAGRGPMLAPQSAPSEPNYASNPGHERSPQISEIQWLIDCQPVPALPEIAQARCTRESGS